MSTRTAITSSEYFCLLSYYPIHLRFLRTRMTSYLVHGFFMDKDTGKGHYDDVLETNQSLNHYGCA